MPGQEDDEYVFDDHPHGMEIQEGNNQIEEAAELRRVPTIPQSGTPNRENAWPSVNCSDDWIRGDEPEEQWEQCPMDIPERMGAVAAEGIYSRMITDSKTRMRPATEASVV